MFQECKHCSANWEEIGSNLGIPYFTLAIIKKDNPVDCKQCMSEMLANWLKRENEKSIPNWTSLCQALHRVHKPTADKIAKKHYVTDYAKQKGKIIIISTVVIIIVGSHKMKDTPTI